MTGTCPSQLNGDATGTLTMICERIFGDVADVPVVSPTYQSRWEKFNSVQLLIMSPMHRRHVPVDAGTSPSLTTIWKPGFRDSFEDGTFPIHLDSKLCVEEQEYRFLHEIAS